MSLLTGTEFNNEKGSRGILLRWMWNKILYKINEAISMNKLIGTIQMFVGDYAPKNYKVCDGSLLQIQEYGGLFAVIGTKYGGDGISTFALPDLRGRTPLGFGQGEGLTARNLGNKGGAESVQLTVENLPEHSHDLNALNGGTEFYTPLDNFLPEYTNTAVKFYAQNNGSTDRLLKMNSACIGSTGEGTAVPNMQPFLTVNFIICTEGVFPTRV
jgi:microcystin-dependent protein